MIKKNLIFFIFLVFLLISIIVSPARFISAGLNGISAWAFNVLPSVLPFMIISQLLLATSYVEKISKPLSLPFVKLYRTNSYSPYVFLISIISGYPVGSKMIADLYEQNKISQTDAFRMSSFCSNSGPMFIVGAVGVGMLASASAGYIILASHIISAMINGLIYRKIRAKDEHSSKILEKASTLSFAGTIENSCKSILNVGAIIMFFFIIIEFISLLISPFPAGVQSLLYGLIEITKGSQCLSTTFALKTTIVLSSIIITFGGLSTALQSLSLLNRVKLPLHLFLLQKTTQAIIAGAVAFVFVVILL